VAAIAKFSKVKFIGAQAPKGTNMKHIETLPFNDARIMVDSGLDHLQVEDFDMSEKMDCYFCPVTGNLWHCYLGQVDLFNILADSVIARLERQYAPLIERHDYV
jgi:hypothetical protein